MDDADAKMSEISDVSSSNHGETSSTKIQELLQKYGRTRTEDSLISMKLPLRSIKESQQSESATGGSLSTSFNSYTTSSNGSASIFPAPFTPATNMVSSRPPLSYSARITPRPRKTNSVTSAKVSFKLEVSL
jgi:hypothetical protein